jgi:hypothetical protein
VWDNGDGRASTVEPVHEHEHPDPDERWVEGEEDRETWVLSTYTVEDDSHVQLSCSCDDPADRPRSLTRA